MWICIFQCRPFKWQRRFYTHTHALLHTFFAHRSFYTQEFYTEKSLHRGAFTHRNFYTQKLLYTDAFTHRRVYTQVRLHTNTQNLLHTEAFPQRSLYTQKPLRTVAFAEKSFTQRRRSFYTEKDLHREAFTQAFTQGSFLHREAFPQSNSRIHTHPQKPSRTEVLHRKLLHKKAFALHRQLFTQRSFCTEKSWHRGPLWHCRIAILPQFCRLTVTHAKGLRLSLRFSKCNFTQVFAVRASCRAKGLRLKFQNCNVTPVFDTRPSFRAKGRCHATENSHFTTRLCVLHTRSPQRVTFRNTPPGCPCRQKREIRPGRGPGAGRVLAVRQFSPLRRREGPPPLPPTYPPTPYHQKVPRFTVFFAVPIFRLLWPKMGQHGPT